MILTMFSQRKDMWVCKCKKAAVTNEGKKPHTKWFTHWAVWFKATC